jgi:hypothetical protein
MEIDLGAVLRRDEAVVGEEPRHAALEPRCLVGLHVAAKLLGMGLQAALGGVEGVAHRDVDVLVGMVHRPLVADHDLAPRRREAQLHAVEAPLAAAPVRGLDDDLAAGDPAVEALEPRHVLADARLQRLGGVHVAEDDAECVHGLTPSWRVARRARRRA